MDTNYLIDTLFDLINESDALDADLADVHANGNIITITVKDGTMFEVAVSKAEN